MIKYLYIKNFALIDELELEFGKKLNIITGETGAGKSIIVDALMLLLGERASIEYIRQGEKKAVIEGRFVLKKEQQVYQDIIDQDYEIENNEIIIRREISAKNSRSFLNDSPIQVSLLKTLGNHLVDFHGQHDHQLLLDKESHITILDSFINDNNLLGEYKIQLNELSNLINDYKSTLKNEQDLKNKYDLIQFELNAIMSISPTENEDIELESKLNIMENSEILFQNSSDLYNILYDQEGSIYDNLIKASKILNLLSDIDKNFKDYVNDLKASIINIEEISKFSNNYSSEIEFDPDIIENHRERMAKLKLLIKKYGSIKSTLDKKNELENTLNLIENFDSEINKISDNINLLKIESGKIAKQISNKRLDAAGYLELDIMNKLNELGIANSQFTIKIKQIPIKNLKVEDRSVIIGNKSFQTFDDGVDVVEFLISANIGEEPKQLAAIASGGEISRIMLAIKSILAESDQLPILIFDEIDTGISGKIAQKVGLAMKSLSKSHQIISITHLPQICGLADRNIFVEKITKNKRTIINAKLLNEEEKINETARLLSGKSITKSTIESAKELIQIK